jgi:hypothetical protein
VNMMREPILEYLKNNVPEVAWTASRSSITGEVVVDGYPEGCFICISLQADHLIVKNPNANNKGRALYYYQDDLFDILVSETCKRYSKKLAMVERAKQVVDTYVTLNKPDLDYLASYYRIEEDGGGNYDYSDTINTLMAEKVKHLKRCKQTNNPG